MILKSIFLYPDLVEFASRKQDLFIVKDQTRHICNYLDRHLAKIKYNAEGFKRICVIGKTLPEKTYINSSFVLTVYIPFNMDECRSIPKNQLSEYYDKLLRIGLQKGSAEYQIPIGELLCWLDELKRADYRNEWTFKEKIFREFGLKCSLECALNLDEFTLRLKISKQSIELFNEIILSTPPDENAFQYKFKDVVIENGQIIVTSGLSNESERILFRTPIPVGQV